MNLDRAAADLRWYFRDSPGDLGLHSNFNAIANRIGGLESHPSTDMDIRKLQTAKRARRIHCALAVIAEHQTGSLFLAYGTTERLGEPKLFRVLCSTEPAVRAYRESKSTRPLEDWLMRLYVAARGGQDAERRRLWLKLSAFAQHQTRSALRAYAVAEGAQRVQTEEAGFLSA